MFESNFRMKKHLIISKGTELLRVPVEHLVYVQADGNYSHVVTRNGRKALVSFQLGQIEDIIEEQLGEGGDSFLRIGRGLIINSTFIYHIDIARQLLVLSDGNECYHELTASKEVLTKLKVWIETEIKTDEK